MVNWKTALIKFKNVNAELDGKHFTDSITDEELKRAENGYNDFSELVSELTHNLISIETDVIECNEIRDLSVIPNSSGRDAVWIDAYNLKSALEGIGCQISMGQYDSIFAVLPYQTEGLDSKYNLWGWGQYDPDTLYGATYACLPVGSPFWDLSKFRGEAYLHEWLHGVCRFFRNNNFSIPVEESDGAKEYGYMSENESWLNYYNDLMNCNISTENGYIGIPNQAWRSGTPSTI